MDIDIEKEVDKVVSAVQARSPKDKEGHKTNETELRGVANEFMGFTVAGDAAGITNITGAPKPKEPV